MIAKVKIQWEISVSYFIRVLNRVWLWVKCLRQGLWIVNSVLNGIGKSENSVLNRVRVWTRGPHLPGYPSICWDPTEINPSDSIQFFDHLRITNSNICESINRWVESPLFHQLQVFYQISCTSLSQLRGCYSINCESII